MESSYRCDNGFEEMYDEQNERIYTDLLGLAIWGFHDEKDYYRCVDRKT